MTFYFTEPSIIISEWYILVQRNLAIFQVKRWEEFPNATFTFDCTDRSIGFYADLEFDCQIFHLCDAAGRRVPYMCDKMTAFNQKYRVCDWAYNVDCEASPDWWVCIQHDGLILKKWFLLSNLSGTTWMIWRMKRLRQRWKVNLQRSIMNFL